MHRTLLSEDDIVGDGVNIAARLKPLPALDRFCSPMPCAGISSIRTTCRSPRWERSNSGMWRKRQPFSPWPIYFRWDFAEAEKKYRKAIKGSEYGLFSYIHLLMLTGRLSEAEKLADGLQPFEHLLHRVGFPEKVRG